MSKISDLTKLTQNCPISYASKMLVYFVFDHGKEPEILTTRYVAEKQMIAEWVKKATEDPEIKIVIVWPGNYRRKDSDKCR